MGRAYAASLEAKTFGRIIDSQAMKEEISHLETTLKELEKPMDYFWRTALYLREKELVARKRMEWLRMQQKVRRTPLEVFSWTNSVRTRR